MVEDDLLVATACSGGVVQMLLVELREKHKGIVGQQVVGIEIDKLLEKGVGLGITLLLDADAGFLIQHLIEQRMGERTARDIVESGPGGIEEVAIEQEVGFGIARKHPESAVVLHVVADKEG